MSLLSGSGLAVWVLNLWLGIGILVEGHFHNESSFWVPGLAVWVLNLLLGFGLPVEGHVHNEFSFWVNSCCLWTISKICYVVICEQCLKYVTRSFVNNV